VIIAVLGNGRATLMVLSWMEVGDFGIAEEILTKK